MSDSTREMNEALHSFSALLIGHNWDDEGRVVCESIAEAFTDCLCSRNLTFSQITPRIVSDYLEERTKICARPLIGSHRLLLEYFLAFLQRSGVIDAEFAMDEICNPLEEPPEDDNVTHLHGKPGFYKKGPCQFSLYFGTLDEMVEKAEKENDGSRKKARKALLKIVKNVTEKLDKLPNQTALPKL